MHREGGNVIYVLRLEGRSVGEDNGWREGKRDEGGEMITCTKN